MVRLFYSEYGIENIARRVLTAYDARLYYGQPSAIPIEDLIEANGLSLEYQYLRKNGRILGKMGHSERRGSGLYRNVPGNQFQPLFEGGVGYFTD